MKQKIVLIVDFIVSQAKPQGNISSERIFGSVVGFVTGVKWFKFLWTKNPQIK